MDEEVVVTREWLASRLGVDGSDDSPIEDSDSTDDTLRVVDVREPWEYDAIGHVPGAVNVPFDTLRDAGDADAGMLPGAEAFARAMSEAGIEPADRIVAYDDHHGVFAARVLVTARCYGHRRGSLLDGDYSAWTREFPVSTEAPAVEETAYEPSEREASPLIDREAVEEAIEAAAEGDAVLLDTREEWEFEEGHLPGAIRFDWLEAVDSDTRGLKPRAELERLVTERGVTPDRRIVLYCNTARRLSHTYLVLRWLGYEDVSIYEGSLTEWLAEGGDVVSTG